MPLHLVGENIDKARSFRAAKAGSLIQLVRGVYVDAFEDADALVLRHAVRIARYLYPRAYLAAASSALLGPGRDGRLFLSGRRTQRTRIRGLEIIQNPAPPNPDTETATIDDGMGAFPIAAATSRHRFLESFRARSEFASSIDETMRESLRLRLIEDFGGPRAAAEAVWALARANSWLREGERAERYLLKQSAGTQATGPTAAQLELHVAWHGGPVGRLQHDGLEWRWLPEEGSGPPLIRQTIPGRLPPFITSLLPEGWLDSVLRNPDERAALRTGKRYVSNVAIVERLSDLSRLSFDVLLSGLASHSRNGIFTGTYSGPGRDAWEGGFERNLARLYEDSTTPRLSGVQIKLPMYLDGAGTLSPATGRPFTHILKPAGSGGFECLPVIEWLCMELGRAAGLAPPASALIAMPDGLPPALLVERFDIRISLEDSRLIALEDLCSVLGLPASAKYSGTIERIARAIRPLSTSPADDILTLFRRALFAWLIADGDMHLKNLALLKYGAPGTDRFIKVKLAPLYDAVTTRVFPRLEHDRMALKLNGKDDRFGRQDFLTLASTIGIRSADAVFAIEDTRSRLDAYLGSLDLPALPGMPSTALAARDRMVEIVRSRLASVL